ncbi:hypothetical protein GA0061100_104159 [Rhizobium hainanense]|uniref:Uncharacterized protein n=2 Tax=Rhizobium hainanense TaxID=52131 RepID=A0A1C3V2P4_9HYPH|nr:hypothetical protein GA0061100_104159 [Rhizobium hainanense]
MNHARNLMSDSVNQPRTFEVFTAVRARRKPRDWSDAEKERFVTTGAILLNSGLFRNFGAAF